MVGRWGVALGDGDGANMKSTGPSALRNSVLICIEIRIGENLYLDHLIRIIGGMFCLVFFSPGGG